MKVVQILSGGMDSATLAYHLADLGAELLLLSFNYGQRHRIELTCAREIARRVPRCTAHFVLDIAPLGIHLLQGSALTTPERQVPHGHYQEESMRQTVVPNRNAIMLSIAWGYAVAEGAQAVAYGAHAGDHFIYPDCRPEFCLALERALQLATDGHGDPGLHLLTPFINLTKAHIVQRGLALGVPYDRTYTCYEGRPVHCGKCGSCTERKEAFVQAEAIDPVEYAA